MLPDRLPVLSAGKQEPGTGKVCAEQAINWLVSGRLDLGDETDHPECVQPVLNALAIAVNDRLPDDRRGEMWPIILRQPGTARPDMEPALSVRLAAWCARQVLDLVRPDDRHVCGRAIDAALAWCDNPTPAAADAARATRAADAARAAYAADAAHAARAAYAAYAARAAAHAAHAAYAARAARAAAHAAHAAAHAAANAADYANADRLLALLAGCQTEHERITGHTPNQPNLDRLERLAHLVGTP